MTESIERLIHPLSANLKDEARLVFVAGEFSKKLSDTKRLPRGVAFRNKHESSELSVQEGLNLRLPIHIIYLASESLPGSGQPAELKMKVKVGKGARLQIFTHVASSGEAFHSVQSRTEMLIEENASVRWVHFEKGSGNSERSNEFVVRLSREASLRGLLIHEGGGIQRDNIRVDLNASESEVSLKGLGLLSRDQELHQQLVVNHNATHTGSRQHFRNILVGRSQSEFDSLVYVGKGSIKADSGQLNKNLVLSDAARAFTRPKLKIDADDVKCNHGSTVGQLDEDEIFYLRSRGLNESAARSVLTYGFAEEILEDLPQGNMRMCAQNDIRLKLETMLGAVDQ